MPIEARFKFNYGLKSYAISHVPSSQTLLANPMRIAAKTGKGQVSDRHMKRADADADSKQWQETDVSHPPPLSHVCESASATSSRWPQAACNEISRVHRRRFSRVQRCT